MNEQIKSKWLSRGKKVFYIVGGIFVFILLIGSIVGGDNKEQAQETTTEQNAAVANETTAQNELSKEEAQKELTELIKLGKESGLVASYEFSDTAVVVYVTDMWYGLPVTFKKDFLAKIATLKKTITGYRHFEVRNVKSNEKVGEVTAFSGSLEVYK